MREKVSAAFLSVRRPKADDDVAETPSGGQKILKTYALIHSGPFPRHRGQHRRSRIRSRPARTVVRCASRSTYGPTVGSFAQRAQRNLRFPATASRVGSAFQGAQKLPERRSGALERRRETIRCATSHNPRGAPIKSNSHAFGPFKEPPDVWKP